MRRLMLCASLTALGVSGLHAQTTTGTITGTVTDTTQAAIPNAVVTVTNTATAMERGTTTDHLGEYRVELLPPGPYSLNVEHPGFRKAAVSGVQLLVNQTRVVNVQLELGVVTEIVEVQAQTGAIETEAASLGQVVESQQVLDLPLNGREFLQLAVLGPGMTPQPFASTSINFNDRSQVFFVSGEKNATVIAGGQRQDSANFFIDGTHNRNPQAGAAGIQPSIEAIQEFKVLTNGFSPEFSRPTIVNVVTRSGGNELHGTVFEFLRNDELDARNFFDAERPKFRQNQFGAVLSGPLSLPNIYDGRNRTFFMANYEGRRIRKGNTFTGTFPSQAMRQGDFSAVPTIFDPATFDPDSGQAQPFPNNQIPQSRFSRIFENTLPFIPLPNISGAGVQDLNFRSSPVDVRDFDQWTARLDQTLTDNDTINARFTLANVRNVFPGVAPLFGSFFRNKGRNLSIQQTHTFSPTIVNQFQFGWQDTDNFRLADGNFGTTNFAADVIGLKNVSSMPSNFGLPTINITGLTSVAGASSFTPQGGAFQQFQFLNQLAIHKGKHSFKIGGSAIRNRFDGLWDLAPRGILNFNGFFTSDRTPGGSRVGFADFALGDFQAALAGVGNTEVFLRYNSYSGFINDDIKISPRLTLNLGIRYEYTQPMKDEQNGLNTFDLEVGRVVRAFDREIRPGIIDPDFNNFAPRVGLAYRPWGDKTVIRAAWGIFYENFEFNEIQFMRNNVPNLIFLSIQNDLVNPSNVDDLFPSAEGAESAFEPFGVDRTARTPYLNQWNFSIQRQLSPSTVLEVAYVGNKGTNLPGRFNPNQAFPEPDPTRSTPVNSRRPLGPGDLRLSFRDQNSIYNSLQVRLERRFSDGLSFLGAYTHGRAIDTCSRASCGHVDNRDFGRDRGVSELGIADRASISATYELPFGRGRRYLANAGGVTNQLLGGWQLNTIMTFATGKMLSPGGGFSNTGGAQVAQRPNVVPGCDPNDLGGAERTVQRYFNTDCFVRQPDGTFGNAGRNIIEGPGLENVDFSVFKTFTIGERHRIEFRSEFFNFLNRPSFIEESLGTNVDSASNYGQLSAALDGRIIQFGLKWRF